MGYITLLFESKAVRIVLIFRIVLTLYYYVFVGFCLLTWHCMEIFDWS